MSRMRILAVLTAIAALALTSVSVAATKAKHVTGGTTTITLSSAATTVLTDHHLTVKPLTPASATGSTLSLPISGGRLNAKLRGFVAQRGGVAFSNGTKTVRLRHLTIVSSASGVALRALVAKVVSPKNGHARVRFYDARVARITGVKVSQGKATGTVRLTSVSAAIINRLAGAKVAAPGNPIGTTTIAPTIA
jgi:hypothetical protein